VLTEFAAAVRLRATLIRADSLQAGMISALLVRKSTSLYRPRVTPYSAGHPALRSAIASLSGAPDATAAKKAAGKYKNTVLLPVTSFDQNPDATTKEPKLQEWWNEHSIYEKLIKTNAGEPFTLHDGPPYANGDLHIGHALNKILKDVINKYHILQGRKVRFVPGWDCHGLPIELKVLQSLKREDREQLSPIQLRRKALQFATETMEAQKAAFKGYGVWGDWNAPYYTAQPAYEAAQISAFGKMVQRGYIYRGLKPVHWSPSSRTALAEAELEYPENHISRSIYVGFKAKDLSEKLCALVPSDADVRIAIWTTTPWTIPANLAVAVNGNLNYCVATHPEVFGGAHFVVGRSLVDALGAKLGLDAAAGKTLRVIGDLRGEDLVGTTYQHPLCDRASSVVLGGDYIQMESGTGLVHTAPGHGQEDYQTGLKYGLPLLSPVNDLGKFTSEAGERFAGKDVLKEGNQEVITALQEAGCLIKEEAYNHKYPYDWRTKKPTIFRATEQWFASVDSFREEALRAIDSVEWIPASGKNNIAGMTQTRGDWCISRQRAWGVPIPVFYRVGDNEPLMTPETLAHIEKVFAQHGSDAWWEMTVAELLPEGELRQVADQYTKGTDTMDVWFDSGTSWAGVLLRNQGQSSSTDIALNYPADMYLEGNDQHRGWFSSSLLTSVAVQGVAPFKTVLTHGFVVDENGDKMSKSLGNVVDPARIISGGRDRKAEPAYGADTLRLWVACADYSGSVRVGANIMKQVFERCFRVRKTMRFLLGSLNDFDPAQHAVPYAQLPSLDKYMLGKLSAVVQEIGVAYEEHKFSRVNFVLNQFIVADVSAFYIEIAKDRLYNPAQNDFRRRSCQTVLAALMEQLSVAVAPILPHLAEEVWQNIPYEKPTLSVFERGWVRPEQLSPAFEEERWAKVRALRHDVNKLVTPACQEKALRGSLEGKVYLHVPDKEDEALVRGLLQGGVFGSAHSADGPVPATVVDDLRFILLVSQVEIVPTLDELRVACPQYYVPGAESESGMAVGLSKAEGTKCARCSAYSPAVGKHHVHSDLCLRCADVMVTDRHDLGSTA
jgi:isoleucyl-tRNA synthetase